MDKNRRIYRLKITLLDVLPPVWRSLLVPSHFTLESLHDVIQAAMGWTDSHLHEFIKDGVSFQPPNPEADRFGEVEPKNSRKARLSQLLPQPGGRMEYVYDFGDDWRHEVRLEEILDRQIGRHYPVCLEGAGACPPEDCGGSPGYEEFLEAIRDPRHPDHEQFKEWIGGPFDPEAFDLFRANRRLGLGKGQIEDWGLKPSGDAGISAPQAGFADGEAIVRALGSDSLEETRAALREAVLRREEATPALVGLLEGLREKAPKFPRGHHANRAILALYLLSQFREKGACAPLSALLRFPGDYLEDFGGAWTTEDLPSVLLSLPFEMRDLQGLVEDPRADQWVRCAALDAVTGLVAQGRLPREEAVRYFLELFQGKLEREPSMVWGNLVCATSDLWPKEAIEEIQRAYDDELVDTTFVRLSDVQRDLERGWEWARKRLEKFNHAPIEDAAKRFETWCSVRDWNEDGTEYEDDEELEEEWEDSSEDFGDLQADPSGGSAQPPPFERWHPPEPYRRTDPKIGRNDPCHCGSGKKYKKCHGA